MLLPFWARRVLRVRLPGHRLARTMMMKIVLLTWGFRGHDISCCTPLQLTCLHAPSADEHNHVTLNASQFAFHVRPVFHV